MTNAEIAKIFDHIATMLEMDGGNPFRVRAYREAARVIEYLPEPAAQLALTEGRLQTQAEDKLRAAGIVVDDNAKEFLGVGVTSVRGKRTPYALCVTLSLYQVVTLARDPKVRAVAPTWETQDVLMSPPKALREASGESIDTLMRRFIEAYKAANA